MRVFQSPGGSLSKLPLASRLLYLCYLGFTLLGLLTAATLYSDAFGWAAQDATGWYQGNADQADAARILVGKSLREMTEISHFHFMTQPVLVLIVGHLFLLSRGGRWKGWVVALTWVLTFAHIAAPWWVWGGSPGWIMAATGGPWMLAVLVMILWPIPDLVWPSSSR